MAAELHVTLCYAPQPRQVHELQLQLPSGSTVAQALHLGGWLQRFPGLASAVDGTGDGGAITLGIWGKPTQTDTILRPHDRLECYRALRVDPKVARRERFNRQGARQAGLFAQRRSGAKPGY